MRGLLIIGFLVAAFGGTRASLATEATELSFEDRVRAYLLENPEVILEALTILSDREAEAEMRARLAQFPGLFEEPARLGLGPEEARLRVVEFFDYKCAPCKAVHPKLEQFVSEQPDVRIEMRHLPILTPGSERAARFALAVEAHAGAAAYATVHAKLWEVRGPLNTVTFERIALGAGLDFAALAPLIESDAISERINFNRDVAIALEILGTPAFVTPKSVMFGTTDIERLAEAWLSQ